MLHRFAGKALFFHLYIRVLRSISSVAVSSRLSDTVCGFFIFLRLILLDAFNERLACFLGSAKRGKPDRKVHPKYRLTKISFEFCKIFYPPK